MRDSARRFRALGSLSGVQSAEILYRPVARGVRSPAQNRPRPEGRYHRPVRDPLSPADHDVLGRLYRAEQERRATRIAYREHPLLAELHFIAAGPGGWAILTAGGRAIAAHGWIDNEVPLPTRPELTEADRAAAFDRAPRRMQEAIKRAKR